MRVLGLCGSLRKDSHNRRLLDASAIELGGDVELTVFEGLGDIPAYSDDTEAPTSVRKLVSAIRAADAVLVATPEYNSSIPGHLKNALDWVSVPFADNPLLGKPAAVIGASTGLFGAVWAQAETRKVLKTIGARVVEMELPIGQADDVLADGLTDPDLRAVLAELLGALVAEVHKAAAG